MTLVLHVLEALEGGTARHLVDVVRHAAKTDHDVVVPPQRVGGLTDETAISRLRDAGATVHLLPMRRTPWAPRNAEAIARLVRLLRARRPDVVHGHSSIGGTLARVAASLSGLHVPRVYTPNGITQDPVGIAAERAQRRLTDRFVAVSESEGQLALRLRLTDPQRLLVVPNGIELAPAPPVRLRELLGLDPDVPVVATIARLVAQKAPLDFVAACGRVAAEIPEAVFVLIGGGAQADEVDGAVRALGLGRRFRRVDSLPGAAGALADVTVFALSSRFEGGPYAPLEAMRAGAACVLTDVVGSRDAIEHGVSGLLVPPADPGALAAGISLLLRDDALRRRLADAGRERVQACFDVSAMGASLDALYDELVRQ